MSFHDRIERGFTNLGHIVCRFPGLVLGAVLAFTALCGSYLPELRSDNSAESFIAQDDPERLKCAVRGENPGS